MSRHVIQKGIKYFQKNGFRKSCKRTVYFIMDRQLYGKLMKATEPTIEELVKQRNAKFEYEPKISIIIPMYKTPLNFFQELVDSIMNQTYSNWELCLADGTGRETDSSRWIKNLIETNEKAAEHIKYTMLDSNDGISGNTNGALKMATGEYVALVDHDDIITVDALYYVVKAINDNGEADSVYSDEDKMDYNGKKFFEPHFKPDFNIDYLRNGNYICHLFVTRTSIAKAIGGFRSDFDGAQDFDFIFRCTERSRIVAHVPRVLYHWRCHPNSTAARPESKMYAYESGVKALSEHYNRCGINAETEIGKSFGYYKSLYVLKDMPLISVITGEEFDASILESISYQNIELITAGGLLEDTSYDCRHTDLAVEEINMAISRAKGEYVLLLDPRINKLSYDLIEKLLGYVQRDDVAMAAARTDSEDGVYHAGIVLGLFDDFGYAFRKLSLDNSGYFMRLKTPQDITAVDMTCTLIKKSVLDSVGELNEDMSILYSMVDYCLQIGDKYADMGKIVYNPNAVAHITESSEVEKRPASKGELFRKKWKDRIEKGDKYYNPNLTKEDSDFTILSWAELKGKKWR